MAAMMARMVPDEPEGDDPRLLGNDAAFAPTVAPQSGTPTPPIAFAVRSIDEPKTIPRSRAISAMESDQTVAAPLSTLPVGVSAPRDVLPTVDDAHYRTDKEIARGGMGKIVAAEDRRLGRPVALKVLIEPAGDALGRFQREALITARLQHPGIVPVYEAGLWPSGEPFFAMKLVSGKPLDRVIADALEFEERLALLPRIASAADAIAYAHSHRIVHRDLKPGNVLIGDFGETVVIDWGLAKDLDDVDSPVSENRRASRDTPVERPTEREIPTERVGVTSYKKTIDRSTLTIAGAVMGTPAYMAPEQARGEPVDQRADVFALGAMLYHLLAGVPPYNARTATDVIAAAALGRVVPLLEREDRAPRDLVALIERAMDPIPAKRYPHAGELADELRRFLTGQLVSAHRYTRAQKLARWVKKHRAAVTIGGLSLIAFAVAGTLAIRQIVHERDVAQYERTLADTRRNAAERLIDKMLSDVKARLVQIGRLDLLANLGAQIREYYRTLATIPGGMPSGDVSRMAVAVELIGRAERDSGKTEQALKTWTDVRDQVAAIVGPDTGADTLGARAMLARLDFQVGTIYQGRGKAAAAVAAYEKARDGFITVLSQAPDQAPYLRQTLLHAGENHDRLGDLLRNDGKIDKAADAYAQGKALRQRAMALAADNPSEEILALSTSHLKLGSVHQARGNTKAAFADYRNALRLRETLLESQPDNVEVQERVIDVQNTLADLQRQIGDHQAAIQTYSTVRPILEGMLRRDASNTAWRRTYGNLLADLGFTLLDGGSFKTGLEELERAIATQRELVERDATNTAWQFDLSRSYTRAGDGHIYLGAVDDGIAKYRTALEIRQTLASANPTNVPYRRSVAWSHSKLGNAYMHKNDFATAIVEHEKALDLRTALVNEAPKQSGFRNELASSEIVLGKLTSSSGASRDVRRGADLVRSGLERARALVTADPINHEWKETVTQGLIARADVAKLANDVATRRSSLEEALGIAGPTGDAAPQSTQWPVFLAEIHGGLAELGDAKTAAAEWKTVRALLEPLDKAGRLYAQRKPLLDRARAGR
jgi:serine/threonine protein kinase